jgi:hypothetical protein
MPTMGWDHAIVQVFIGLEDEKNGKTSGHLVI